MLWDYFRLYECYGTILGYMNAMGLLGFMNAMALF